MNEIEHKVKSAAGKAKSASSQLALLSCEQRNQALFAMAASLRVHVEDIVKANAQDMRAGKAAGMEEGLLDRLRLDASRVNAMAAGLESLAALPDPLGCVLEHREIDCGLDLSRISVPLGVVAMVYEARPNVTADAAGICLKSGNACVLRGGSSALNSNRAIVSALHAALDDCSIERSAIAFIDSADRAATDALMRLRGVVDVLIPRGGAGLISHCVENSLVPVIETGTGNCHVYVHETANFSQAVDILLNAKTQRVGVCNACESLLVDKRIARAFFKDAFKALAQAGVTVHGDETAALVAADVAGLEFTPATNDDWGREYLSLDISAKVVEDPAEAISHINRFGTGHSECICADESTEGGKRAVDMFLTMVDAAAVYANASTRFTDGGCFGLGAEIGISTQKLHVRGPFALQALTTSKYVIKGAGQVRP